LQPSADRQGAGVAPSPLGYADAGDVVTLCVLKAHSLQASMAKDIQYRGRKLIARQYANGWQVEIIPLQRGHVDQNNDLQRI
jgi:hypothetical protein